jgi:hypothetical protein
VIGRAEVDYTGRRLGRLVVLNRVATPPGKTGRWWKLRCDCGQVITACSNRFSTASTGFISHCGCQSVKKGGPRNSNNFLFPVKPVVPSLADQFENDPVEPSKPPIYAELRFLIPGLPSRNHYHE